MFVNVAVVLPVQEKVLTIPATAVLYAPYSDSVFVVEEMKSEKDGQPQKVVRQQFVRLGEKRGDFIDCDNRAEGRRDRSKHRGLQTSQRPDRYRGQSSRP